MHLCILILYCWHNNHALKQHGTTGLNICLWLYKAPFIRVSCIIVKMYGQWTSSERWSTESLLFREHNHKSIQMLRCGFIIYCYQKGCSNPGVYGGQCNKPCPENCQEHRCDIINGTCLGCTPGWMGDSCTTGKKYIIPINFLTW